MELIGGQSRIWDESGFTLNSAYVDNECHSALGREEEEEEEEEEEVEEEAVKEQGVGRRRRMMMIHGRVCN